MALTGITAEDYSKFLEEGGTMNLDIDIDDLQLSHEVQQQLGTTLYSGFELHPTEQIFLQPTERTNTDLFSQSWDRSIKYIHGSCGNIIYKKKSSGFSVRIMLPTSIDQKVLCMKQQYFDKHGENPTKVYLTSKQESLLQLDPRCHIALTPRQCFTKILGLNTEWDSETFRVE